LVDLISHAHRINLTEQQDWTDQQNQYKNHQKEALHNLEEDSNRAAKFLCEVTCVDALGHVKDCLYLGELHPLKDVEGGLGESPVDDCPQLEDERNRKVRSEGVAADEVIFTDHETTFTNLWQTDSDLGAS